MLKLGVKKYAEATQLVSPDKVYGSVEQVLKDFIKSEDLPTAELIIKDEFNANTVGRQMMFLFREINKDKKEEDLFCSDDIMLSKTMSDAIRTGELHTSALKQFMIVEHENNTNGAIYPLMVRPQEVSKDRKAIDKLSVKADTKVTKAYKRESVTSTISKFNL